MNLIVRRAVAISFALHGLIHVMGFAAAWQLATLPEIADRTTALNGAVEIGDVGARLLGVGWLVGGAPSSSPRGAPGEVRRGRFAGRWSRRLSRW